MGRNTIKFLKSAITSTISEIDPLMWECQCFRLHIAEVIDTNDGYIE